MRKYSDKEKEKLIKLVLTEISSGKSLRKSCGLCNVPFQTMDDWLRKDNDLNGQYTRARNDRSDIIFEEILDIADNQEDDVYTDSEGNEHTNHNVINRAKLRIDSRKWMLGKMQPKKYGDKLDVTSDGEKLNISPIQWTKSNED